MSSISDWGLVSDYVYDFNLLRWKVLDMFKLRSRLFCVCVCVGLVVGFFKRWGRSQVTVRMRVGAMVPVSLRVSSRRAAGEQGKPCLYLQVSPVPASPP